MRGPNLAAVRADGLRLGREDGTEAHVHPRAVERIGEAGVQDLVVLGMKAHQVAAVAAEIPQLLPMYGKKVTVTYKGVHYLDLCIT